MDDRWLAGNKSFDRLTESDRCEIQAMRVGRLFVVVGVLTVLAISTESSNMAKAPRETVDRVVPFGQPRMAEADDGWRRTADGWENISEWKSYATDPSPIASRKAPAIEAIPSSHHLALIPGWRVDFHPAFLAFFQVTLIAWLLGFAAQPDRAETEPS
jgi:hypothetical protein